MDLDKADSKLVIVDLDKAEMLNEQFQFVFTIHSMGPLHFPTYPQMIDQSKITGPHEILSRVIKETAKQSFLMIIHILQQSYDYGTMPDNWSRALVLAAYQKGNKSDPLNHKPMSLTL